MSIDTVNDLPPRVQYVASAAQTDFDYTFPIFADADLVVDVDGVTQTLTTDYTVAGEGDDAGGTVTFLSAMAGSEIVTIYRSMAIERTTDFSQNGEFSSATFNDELDRITLVLQDLRSQINRSLRLPMIADATDADIELAPIASWLGKAIKIDENGVPVPLTLTEGTVADLATRQVFTATAGQTTFTIAGGYTVGAVDVYQNGAKLVATEDFAATNGSTVVLTTGATVSDRIDITAWSINPSYLPRYHEATAAEGLAAVSISDYSWPPGDIRRYGAVSLADSTTAIQAAINSAEAGGGAVYVPAGTYLVASTLTCDSGSVTVYGDGDASVLKLANGADLVLNRILYFNGCDSATAHDLKFDGNKANNSGGTSQALCEAVNVPIVKFYALTSVDSDTDGISVRNSSVGYIEGCHIEGCSLSGAKFTSVTLTRAINNTFKNCQRAIGIEDVACSDIIVNGNTIYGDGGSTQVNGITIATDYTDLEQSERIVVSNNVIRNCGQGHTTGAGVAINCDQVAVGEGEIAITGNEFYGCRDAIAANRTRGISIIGNIVKGSDIRGISLAGCADVSIVGNILSEHDSHATTARSISVAVHSTPSTLNCDGVSVIGNTIYNSTQANSPAGIYVSDSSQTNVIATGNQISGCTTAISAYTGTGAITRANRGYVTEAKGTATIASGATTAVVTHGLAYTPAVSEISLTPGEQGTNDYGRVWVDTITSTQFTINVSADPGASNLDVGWAVRKV